MAIWLEMRCEGRVDLRSQGCWSLKNNGPMLMAGDTVADVQHGHRELVKQANRMKWTRTRKGWFCPACTAHGVSPSAVNTIAPSGTDGGKSRG